MLPSYLEKLTPIDLQERAKKLHELQSLCRLCPNECDVNREEGEVGKCHSTGTVRVSSYGAHYGEEEPLVGAMGSGTIFFAHCNMKCEFCQNHDISQQSNGREVKVEELADIMVSLQNKGCHNLNLVTPTHFVPQIVDALLIAIDRDFQLPIVYNCGGYESVETLELLKDIVDIYMPDIKYGDDEAAAKYSHIEGYWDIVRAAVKEMYKQVGVLKLSKKGYAEKGLLVRHLVLPNDAAKSKVVLDFIANEVSKDTYVNIMEQYFPAFKADNHPELERGITESEYEEVIEHAKLLGLPIHT